MTATPEITRTFGIDVGHRLLKHEGKCKHLHGHRYEIEVSCIGLSRLDEVGRVIDFGVIKQSVGDWLDSVFDHGFVVEDGDPLIPWMTEHKQKHVVLDCPPSIENLVEIWFMGAANIMADHGIVVTKVKAYETPNCWAEYTKENARAREAINAARQDAIDARQPAPQGA